jgi:hypothetical protein
MSGHHGINPMLEFTPKKRLSGLQARKTTPALAVKGLK